MKMEKVLEELGWDQEILDVFTTEKKAFSKKNYQFENTASTEIESFDNSQDGMEFKGILEVPVGSNHLFVK